MLPIQPTVGFLIVILKSFKQVVFSSYSINIKIMFSNDSYTPDDLDNLIVQ